MDIIEVKENDSTTSLSFNVSAAREVKETEESGLTTGLPW